MSEAKSGEGQCGEDCLTHYPSPLPSPRGEREI